MGKGRLEAFSDGVMAVIITIMVLELKTPHEPTLQALLANLPVFLSYVLSFVYVGIYWNNHHHMLHAVQHVNGRVMWSNLFFLFWLSLFPFVTSWINESHPFPAPVPTALYGVVLLMAALSWIPLGRALIACNGGHQGTLGRALGGEHGDWKEKISPVMYIVGIGLSFVVPVVSCILYTVVAILWFIPDRRIEHQLKQHE
ncbi:MAG: DUF1211 domain-containing protein [Proteobacteria bacterium]|nr:DUF1211 domain-containing protein [Pseudomonadota bacterium]